MADYANQQQKIKEVTEQLEAGIKDFFSSEKFQEYLNVMSCFHSYSYSNSMMIAMRMPHCWPVFPAGRRILTGM